MVTIAWWDVALDVLSVGTSAWATIEGQKIAEKSAAAQAEVARLQLQIAAEERKRAEAEAAKAKVLPVLTEETKAEITKWILPAGLLVGGYLLLRKK